MPGPEFDGNGYDQYIVNIFGAERMSLVAGNEATPETTRELSSVITTVCNEDAAHEHLEDTAHEHLSTRFRIFNGSSDDLIGLQDIAGFGDTKVDTASVSVRGFASGDASRPMGYPRRYGYQFNESMFIDGNGTAQIRRVISARAANDSVGTLSATKPATEREVQEVIDTVVAAAFYAKDAHSKTS